MPESLYNAINGQEARAILIKHITNYINSLPYLKRGNTFHKFRARYIVEVFAFPEDVPVPSGEFEFEFPNIPNNEEYQTFKVEFERYFDNLDKLMELRDQINEIINNHVGYSSSGNQVIDDRATPDELRQKENLPLHVLEVNKNLNRTEEIAVDSQTYKPVTFDDARLLK